MPSLASANAPLIQPVLQRELLFTHSSAEQGSPGLRALPCTLLPNPALGTRHHERVLLNNQVA